MSALARPRTEQGGPDAYQGGAFRDGGFQVTGHAHGKGIERMALGAQSMEGEVQGMKVASLLGRAMRPRSRNRGSRSSCATSDGNSAGATPAFCRSTPMFT